MTLPDWILEIENRASMASSGPWHVGHVNENESEFADIDSPSQNIAENVCDENRTFIIHSRTDIPRLVDSLKIALEALESIANFTADYSNLPTLEAREAREVLAKIRGEK